jgi:Ala-tRNA(Pro) deacylase
MNLEERIMNLIQKQGCPVEVVEHEPVYTNPVMAEVLGVPESQTVKSLVVKTREGQLAVVVMPGDGRIDWKRTAKAIGTKKVSMAKPEMVAEKVGCEVGCVPPFGHQESMPVIMDPGLKDHSQVYFNPGVHHKSCRIQTRDLIELCKPYFLEQDGSSDTQLS